MKKINEISKLITKQKKFNKQREDTKSEIEKNKDMIAVWFDDPEKLKKYKQRLNYYEKKLNKIELKLIDNKDKIREIQLSNIYKLGDKNVT